MSQPTAAASWRLIHDADVVRLYRFLTQTEPRWWRMVRAGLAPATVLTQATLYNALTVIEARGDVIGVAGVTDLSTSGISGTLDIVSLPEAASSVATVVPQIVASIFRAVPIQHLHAERFADDPDLFGEMSAIWQHEVTFPEFALVEGAYTDRVVYGVSRRDVDDWLADHPSVAEGVQTLHATT